MKKYLPKIEKMIKEAQNNADQEKVFMKGSLTEGDWEMHLENKRIFEEIYSILTKLKLAIEEDNSETLLVLALILEGMIDDERFPEEEDVKFLKEIIHEIDF